VRRALEYDPLAAPEEAQPEAQRGEDRDHGKRYLDAQEALPGPVDVLELEQQRGLVERQPHADSERHGQPGLEALVASHDRHRAGAPVRLERPAPPHVQRSSRSSSGTSRICRAGTPMTTARAGTSRVTTAPAATKASSPTSMPGRTTTPPPTRLARRRVAPRIS